jgi:hypothetical protein
MPRSRLRPTPRPADQPTHAEETTVAVAGPRTGLPRSGWRSIDRPRPRPASTTAAASRTQDDDPQRPIGITTARETEAGR